MTESGIRLRVYKGIIFLTALGGGNFQAANDAIRDTAAKVRLLRRRNQPVLLFIDASKVSSQDSATWSNAKDFFKLDFDKVAVYGLESRLFDLLIHIIGLRYRQKLRLFKSSDAAIRWLNEKKTATFSINDLTRQLKSYQFLLASTLILGLFFTAMIYNQLESNVRARSRTIAQHVAAQSAAEAKVKFDAYVTTLYGFKSYFSADNQVSREEFHRYFTSLDLSRRFPGFRAITYVRQVSAADRDAVTDEIRQDASMPEETVSDFTIQNDAPQDYYLPVVFVEPMPADLSGFGVDLSTMRERFNAIKLARASGKPAASKSVQLLVNGKPGPEKGFLLTLPVDGGFASDNQGYINAVFSYRQLFANTLQTDLGAYQITDHENRPIFRSDNFKPEYTKLSSADIPVADSALHLAMFGPVNFGADPITKNSPYIALAAGILVTSLAMLAIYNALQTRQAAYELAQRITADLQISEHQRELMIDSVKDYAIYRIDAHGNVTTWNRGAEMIKGYKTDEILGKNISTFYPESDKATPRRLLSEARQTGRAEAEGWRVRQDGSQFWASVTISAIRDEAGKLLGFTKVTRDMTRYRMLEEERDNFVAVATHELKTPTTSIKAYAQVLERRFARAGDQESAELLGRMDDQISKLNKLVGDLLDVSKIKTGTLRFNFRRFDLDKLVRQIVEELHLISVEHKIRITGRIGTMIIGDKARINQVLTNLIENAMKYTPKTSDISIRLSKQDHMAKVSVTDHGPGISTEEQPRIFERFYRSKESNKTAGFGLGLFISAEIARAHGGALTISSTPGEGSTFVLLLPFEAKLAQSTES